MASFRPDKMASALRLLISEAISTKVSDPRVSRFASVTRVHVSGDLQMAKVYISVLGSDADGRRTLAGLQAARGHIQRWVARNLSVRNVPEIRFVVDESIKGSAQTVRMIDEAMRDVPPDDDEIAVEDTDSDSDGATA
jgi:ribosome-binding factor A